MLIELGLVQDCILRMVSSVYLARANIICNRCFSGASEVWQTCIKEMGECGEEHLKLFLISKILILFVVLAYSMRRFCKS